jgi:hypothetical protein
MAEPLATSDAKLAAYLCLIGYDTPVYGAERGVVQYIFDGVRQQDVLNFYNKIPITIAPLAVFDKYTQLMAHSRISHLQIPVAVFQSLAH